MVKLRWVFFWTVFLTFCVLAVVDYLRVTLFASSASVPAVSLARPSSSNGRPRRSPAVAKKSKHSSSSHSAHPSPRASRSGGGGAVNTQALLSPPPDGWEMPPMAELRATVEQLTTRFPSLDEGIDFFDRPISYNGLSPLRLSVVDNHFYLVYIYVNYRSIEVALNCALSLKLWGVSNVLMLCEDELTCAFFAAKGLYHFFPKSLVETINSTRASYWGPSMWVRCNFNYHLLMHGVSVATVDADVVFVSDPRPILFNSSVDISTSIHFRRYFPWVWSFPFYDRPGFFKEKSVHAAQKRHFLEMNNAISRYSSTPSTQLLFERTRSRMVFEIEHAERYSGWDQTALAYVLDHAQLSFSHVLVPLQTEFVLLAGSNNEFNVSVLAFQPATYLTSEVMSLRRPEFASKSMTGGHFCYHALGHVRKPEEAWLAKKHLLEKICWLLTPDAMNHTRSPSNVDLLGPMLEEETSRLSSEDWFFKETLLVNRSCIQ